MKKFPCKAPLIFCLIIFPFFSNAQSNARDSLKIDSLKRVLLAQKEDSNIVITLYNLGYEQILIGNYQIALSYLDPALALAKKLDFKKGEGFSYLYKGRAYYKLHNYPESEKLFLQAKDLFNELRLYKDMCETYSFLSGIYFYQRKYSAELGILYKLLDLSQKIGDQEHQAEAYESIGTSYYTMDNDSLALKNYMQSVAINKQIGDTGGFAHTNVIIGDIYYYRGDYAKAMPLYSESLVIYKRPGYPKIGLAMSYERVAWILMAEADRADSEGNKMLAKAQYLDALNNFKLAQQAWQASSVPAAGASEAYSNIGSVYVRLKQPSLAIKYYLISESLVKGTRGINAGNLKALSEIYLSQGNYKKAYEYYTNYISVRDTLNNDNEIRKTQATALQYEFDKKEGLSKSAQEKKDIETKRIRSQQYFVIAGLGVTVLAVLIITLIQFRNNKHKQQANLLLQQQKAKVESTLSELKSAQLQLIQSEKMASLGDLTAGIAHEIQNPLNFVNNFSDVNKELLAELKEEADKGNIDEVKAIANDVIDNEEKINHHGKRADAIVKGMLQHSRMSTGTKEMTDINALCDEYLRLSYHGLRAKDKDFNATIKTDFDNAIGKTNIIPQDIGRVLLNLYNNAFYAVNEKKKSNVEGYDPTVSIRSGKSADQVVITVSDNGSGIPKNIVEKIFQPFFTTKPTGQGTGLGLSLSYDIIKAHGGEIRVDTKVDEGSSFVVVLPLIT